MRRDTQFIINMKGFFFWEPLNIVDIFIIGNKKQEGSKKNFSFIMKQNILVLHFFLKP